MGFEGEIHSRAVRVLCEYFLEGSLGRLCPSWRAFMRRSGVTACSKLGDAVDAVLIH